MSSEDRGLHGSTALEGGGCRSRTLRMSVRETVAASIGVYVNTNPTRSGVRRGARRQAATQERDCGFCGRGEAAGWGQSIHRGAFSNGGSRSGGIPGFPVPYKIPPSPGFEAPARFVGKWRKQR